jgi:hypothetical protein
MPLDVQIPISLRIVYIRKAAEESVVFLRLCLQSEAFFGTPFIIIKALSADKQLL